MSIKVVNELETDSGGSTIPPASPPVVPLTPDQITEGTGIVPVEIPTLPPGAVVPPVTPIVPVVPVPVDPIEQLIGQIGDALGSVLDLSALLGETMLNAYNNLDDAQKVEYLQAILDWAQGQIESSISPEAQQALDQLQEVLPLGLAITTDQMDQLKAAEEFLRAMYGDSKTMFAFTDPAARVVTWIDSHPEGTIQELYSYLLWDADPGSRTLPDPNSLHYLLDHNWAYKNAKWPEAQAEYAKVVMQQLKVIRSCGYGSMSAKDFIELSDRMDALFDGTMLYGDAVLSALRASLERNPDDDEAAFLYFMESLSKMMPDFKETWAFIQEHATTATNLIGLMMTNLAEWVGQRMGDKYLGEGGYYPRQTALTGLGNILIALMSTNPDMKGSIDAVLEVWPLRSSDGVPFLPTSSGVYYFVPNAVGSNLRFIENRWDGAVNITMELVNAISVAKIPYASVMAKVVSLGLDVYAVVDSYQYAIGASLASDSYTYGDWAANLAKIAKNKLVPYVIQNYGSKIKTGITTGITKVGDAITDVAQDVVTGVKSGFTKIPEIVSGLVTHSETGKVDVPASVPLEAPVVNPLPGSSNPGSPIPSIEGPRPVGVQRLSDLRRKGNV